jgi:hypothetical protein
MTYRQKQVLMICNFISHSCVTFGSVYKLVYKRNYYFMRKNNIYRQCKIILHCQSIQTMLSAMSPHFFDMIWKVETFLLIVSVKLIYTDSAYSLILTRM